MHCIKMTTGAAKQSKQKSGCDVKRTSVVTRTCIASSAFVYSSCAISWGVLPGSAVSEVAVRRALGGGRGGGGGGCAFYISVLSERLSV
jgi:hypothetical protein